MTEIRVPKWGLTMEDAEVSAIFKNVGDAIEAGEAILELDADKVTGVVESPVAGRITAIHVGLGDVVPVETLLVSVEEEA
ncbi:MAG: biotin/lipoyl-containing protein [Actinomycetota bacterium]|nr:biotin/lipoyl-containing protein [Actinomycetota bacterium]